MPIKNLTDNIVPRLPRLGKLRKGGEKVNNQYGPDLDHFRFRSANPDIVAAFEAAYGKEPRAVQAYLPATTPQEAFITWAEIWGATGLVHRCDGENMTIWQDKGHYVRGAAKCAGGHEKGDYLNDAVGRLDVIIPQLVEAGYVGTVTLETHAKHDILNIMATLQSVYETRQNNPLGLRGILFNIYRIQESVTTPGFGKQEGKRSRVDKWLVKIEPAADWVRLQLEMAHNSQMGLLPAGNEDDVIDGEAKDATTPSNGNGKLKNDPQPVETDPDELGIQLWPGLWEKVKESTVAKKAKDAQGNEITPLIFALHRLETVTTEDGLTDHVKKAWPGMEALVPGIVKDMGAAFDPITAIRAIATANKKHLENKDLNTQALLDIALVEIKIPEGF